MKHLQWRRVFLPLSVFILLSAALAVPLPLFLERPGELVSLVEHVDVAEEARDDAQIEGDYLLTLINVRRATLVLLIHGLLSSDVDVVPAVRLTGGQDDEVYFERQRDLFATTAELAAGVGLRAAGYPIEFRQPVGARVVGVVPGAPAAGVLRPGDVITTVGDTPVRSASEVVAAVRDAGQTSLEVVLLRGDDERRVQVTPGEVPGMDGAGLGVRVEDLLPRIDLPVPVEIDSGRIGGPSAGLLIALTVYDLASSEDLTAGRRVAGTGGVTVDGTVTPMGGIPLKVLAAARQGAQVFLVPAEQYEDARDAVPAGSALEVIGVATVDEALDALRRSGAAAARGGDAAALLPEPLAALAPAA